MKKEVKKLKKKKVVKNKRKRLKKKRKSGVKNLKVSNTKNFNYNLTLMKMVSIIGLATIFGIQSHKEIPISKDVEKVSYTREISNLNVNFDAFELINDYGIAMANEVSFVNDNVDEIICYDNIIMDTEVYDEYEDEICDELEFEFYDEVENCDDITIIGEDEIFADDEYEDEIEIVNEPSDCGMKLTREFENDITSIANEYGFDSPIMLVIGDQESDGKWNNNGLISDTKDYGVFQINEYNHPHIEDVFGYSSDDLRYDPIKNTHAAAYIISNIISRSDVNSLEDIFGMYNGWTNWRNIEGSVKYVNECMERLNKYFPNYSYENNKELIKTM